MLFKRSKRGQVGLRQNVEYRLFDKDGKPKRMFQQNALFTWLLKKGIVTPHCPKIPFLFGTWTDGGIRIANLVTNAGKALTADRINGATGEAAADWIAIGTGTVAAAVTDTALGAEITTGGGARAQGTASRVTTTVTNDTARVVHTFNFTLSFAVTESGVLNASTGGDLLCRDTFSAINVANGDSLQITWDVAVS